MKTTTQQGSGIAIPTFENIQEVLDGIRSWAGERGYRLEGDLSIDPEETAAAVAALSKNQWKKLGRSLNRAAKKPSLYTVNMLLHALYKRVLARERGVPRALPSEREQRIQDARKKWVEARNAARLALDEYKNIKADFYRAK
jgi:hypothetical protein